MLKIFLFLASGLLTPLPSELLFQNSPLPPFSGEVLVKALSKAYPKRISNFGSEDGEWFVAVGGKRFAFAQGRMLKWEIRQDWESWDRQDYYFYPPPFIDPNTWSQELLIKAEAALKTRWDSQIRRNSEFHDTLWKISSRQSAEDRMVYVRFQGFRVRVHQDLQSTMNRINTQIQELRARNPEVAAYFRSLKTIDGYNWRPVAGTASRSFHSYGAALDLVPKNYRGKTAYWRWSFEEEGNWFLKAWNNRHLPPAGLVKVFEDNGFVWGGRWFLFDTMHFEYRPELFLLKD